MKLKSPVPLPGFISCSLSPETTAVVPQRAWTLLYTVTTHHTHTHPIQFYFVQFVRLGLIHIVLSLICWNALISLFSLHFQAPSMLLQFRGWQAFSIKGQVANILGSGGLIRALFHIPFYSCFGSVFHVLAPFKSMKTILSPRARQTHCSDSFTLTAREHPFPSQEYGAVYSPINRHMGIIQCPALTNSTAVNLWNLFSTSFSSEHQTDTEQDSHIAESGQTRGQYFLGDCTEIKMLCVCMCVCTQMEKMIEQPLTHHPQLVVLFSC